MGRSCSAAAAVLFATASCYAPNATVGAPCGPNLECPSGQLCDLFAPGGPICAKSASSIGIDGGEAPDGSGTGDVDAGTTIARPANDLPANAADVGAGGTFLWDPTNALDDFAAPCAAGAGPDVFFMITLAAPEVIYLDTLGMSANSVIAVHAGDCTSISTAEACVDDSCGGTQSQLAWNLGAGTHCIVVDQVGGATGTTGRLLVTRGTRAGDPLVGASGSVTGNTCMDDNSHSASCGSEPAEDHHYFTAVCPGMHAMHAETCAGATWDTVLQIRDNSNTSLGCSDDNCGVVSSDLTRMVTGPGLFWTIIDGFNECGPYTMLYSLN